MSSEHTREEYTRVEHTREEPTRSSDNEQNDFEDLSQGTPTEQQVDSNYADDEGRVSPVEQQPAAGQRAMMANHVSESIEDDDTSSNHTPDQYESSPTHTRRNNSGRDDEQYRDQPPTYNSAGYEDEDDIKGAGSDISVSSEDDRTASETSEMLKKRMPPKVRNILYWNCPITSGVLLSVLLLIEFCLLYFSVISVLAYTGIALLLASVGLKLYVQFVSGGSSTTIHNYMDANWTISRERTEEVSRAILEKLNVYALYVRDLFLIHNYGESIKFAIFLYVLTYIGAWFNFLTLVILATIFSFTIPKVYDMNKSEIDHYFVLARRQFKEKWSILRDKMEDLPVVGQKIKRN